MISSEFYFSRRDQLKLWLIANAGASRWSSISSRGGHSLTWSSHYDALHTSLTLDRGQQSWLVSHNISKCCKFSAVLKSWETMLMIWVIHCQWLQFIVLFAEKLDGLHEEAQTQQGEKEYNIEATCSLVLMPRSLLVFKDSAYAGKLRGVYVWTSHFGLWRHSRSRTY